MSLTLPVLRGQTAYSRGPLGKKKGVALCLALWGISDKVVGRGGGKGSPENRKSEGLPETCTEQGQRGGSPKRMCRPTVSLCSHLPAVTFVLAMSSHAHSAAAAWHLHALHTAHLPTFCLLPSKPAALAQRRPYCFSLTPHPTVPAKCSTSCLPLLNSSASLNALSRLNKKIP